jgi:MFS family permease
VNVVIGYKIRASANLLSAAGCAATVGDVLRRNSPARDGATYGAALASPGFRALFAAAGLSVTGNVVADIVQTVLIYDRTHSPLLSSLSFALGFLPFLVTGTMLSGLVDRMPPRRLLVSGCLAAAATTAVMALPGLSVGALLALVTATGFANGLANATQGALLRASVSEAAYVPARSLMRIASQVAQVAANPIGGLLIVVFSARGTFLVASGILAAAALIGRLGIGAGSAAGGSGGVLRDSLRGMREVFALPGLRRLLLLGWVIPLFSVAPESLAAPYVVSRGGSAALVGWWLVGLPAGIVAGDLLGVWLIPPAWQRRLVGAAGIASFLPYLAFALSPPVAVCVPLLVLSGMCSMYSLGLDARVRDAAPQALFARMMALNGAGLLTIQALGFPLAGAIGTAVSPGLAVGIAGACGIAGTLLLWPRQDGGELLDPGVNGRADLDGAADRAQALVGLLDDVRQHGTGVVAVGPLGERDPERHHDVAEVIALLAAGLHGVHRDFELLRLRSPRRD